MSVDPDGSAVHIIEPHEQFDHGGFSCSGRTYDSDLLSFFYICRKVVNNNPVRVVAEMHMIKLYISLQPFCRYRIGNCLFLFFLFQELKYPFRRRCRGLKHIGDLRHLLNGLGKVSDILDKGLDIADFDCIPDCQISAQYGHRHISQVAHKLHNRHHHSGKELRFPCGIIQLLVCPVEFSDYVFFFIKRFYNAVAAVDFFYLSVYISKVFLLSPEIFLGMFHYK